MQVTELFSARWKSLVAAQRKEARLSYLIMQRESCQEMKYVMSLYIHKSLNVLSMSKPHFRTYENRVAHLNFIHCYRVSNDLHKNNLLMAH